MVHRRPAPASIARRVCTPPWQGLPGGASATLPSATAQAQSHRLAAASDPAPRPPPAALPSPACSCLGLTVLCNGGHYTNDPAKFISMAVWIPLAAFLLMINHVRFLHPYGAPACFLACALLPAPSCLLFSRTLPAGWLRLLTVCQMKG